MDKQTPKLSNSLLTPEPHYIPGFVGHCPQLKFNGGKSYGQLTAEMLRLPNIKCSAHRVVSDHHVPSAEYDSALTLRMIPGFTGFIPKRHNYFGSSYSDTCRKAISEFNQERRTRTQRSSSDLPALVYHTNPHPERLRPSLAATSGTVFRYKPLKPFTPLRTPYVMDDDDPNKHFILGFSGHVPKSRFLFGKGYAVTTNQALIQFGEQQRTDPRSQNNSGRKDSSVVTKSTIYPTDSRMVPSFSGHIPGYKFMCGDTFGNLSRNVLEKSGIKRISQDKS
ncbi:protein FAM166B [Xyrichtys novacula]|uniref:Ciliary microtubule inner protein 2B n=1 Tax=Xyrichtys novacula TaxID=13765 RepID=A0AAV1GLR6_XYRNO|nr:protein FAM166B [Xyrichtys novacula]